MEFLTRVSSSVAAAVSLSQTCRSDRPPVPGPRARQASSSRRPRCLKSRKLILCLIPLAFSHDTQISAFFGVEQYKGCVVRLIVLLLRIFDGESLRRSLPHQGDISIVHHTHQSHADVSPALHIWHVLRNGAIFEPHEVIHSS
jgi:hypothetical protein